MRAADKFIQAVLGEAGAKALAKAGARSPELQQALLPRVVLSWLDITARANFSGIIPGVEGSSLDFTKSESGYAGNISIDGASHEFTANSPLFLGAVVAAALGGTGAGLAKAIKDSDLTKLGVSIDIMTKATFLRLSKADMGAPLGMSEPVPLEKRSKNVRTRIMERENRLGAKGVETQQLVHLDRQGFAPTFGRADMSYSPEMDRVEIGHDTSIPAIHEAGHAHRHSTRVLCRGPSSSNWSTSHSRP